jgi:hypothetical protein
MVLLIGINAFRGQAAQSCWRSALCGANVGMVPSSFRTRADAALTGANKGNRL